MEVRKVVIDYRTGDEKKIYVVGDTHIGTIHFAEAEFTQKVLRAIEKDDHAYWIGMGDYCEFITHTDSRWDDGSLAPWVHKDNIAEDQMVRFMDLVSPIKHKCLGLLYGNHEDSYRLHGGGDVHKNLCTRLGVLDLGFSCIYHFHFVRDRSRRLIRGVFTHGSSGAITKGAKTNVLVRFMHDFEGDMYAMGHLHDTISDDVTVLTTNKTGTIVAKSRTGVVSGCWFRTYTQGKRASYG